MSPGATFRFDVDGAPVASPGRTEINPAPVGNTAVTFNNTPVAPAGTTTRLISCWSASIHVPMVPVTINFWDVPASNLPVTPMLYRVSRTRVGSTVTTVDSVAPGNANTRPGETTDAVTTPAATKAPTTATPANKTRKREKDFNTTRGVLSVQRPNRYAGPTCNAPQTTPGTQTRPATGNRQRDAHSFRVARSDPDVRIRSSPYSTHLRSPLRVFRWRSRRPAEALEIATGTVQVDLAMGADEIDWVALDLPEPSPPRLCDARGLRRCAPALAKAVSYAATQKNPLPATAPPSAVSATFAFDVPTLKMLLVVPVIDEFRIVGDDEQLYTPRCRCRRWRWRSHCSSTATTNQVVARRSCWCRRWRWRSHCSSTATTNAEAGCGVRWRWRSHCSSTATKKVVTPSAVPPVAVAVTLFIDGDDEVLYTP